MPLYEYECLVCGEHFEKLQRFGDPEPETCPNGHTQVHRLLGHPAIIFKGSGFYVTDNRRNGNSATSGSSRKPKETEETGKAETASAGEAKEGVTGTDTQAASKD